MAVLGLVCSQCIWHSHSCTAMVGDLGLYTANTSALALGRCLGPRWKRIYYIKVFGNNIRYYDILIGYL